MSLFKKSTLIAMVTFLSFSTFAQESNLQLKYKTFEVNGLVFGAKVIDEIRTKEEISNEDKHEVGSRIMFKNGDYLDFFDDVLVSGLFMNIQDAVEIDEIIKNLEKKFKTKANSFTSKFTEDSYEFNISGKKVKISNIGEVVFSLKRTKKALNKDKCGRDVFDETGPNSGAFKTEFIRRCLGKPIEIEGFTIWTTHLQAGQDMDRQINDLIKNQELLKKKSELQKKQDAIDRAKKF